jgi:hypothetical protein
MRVRKRRDGYAMEMEKEDGGRNKRKYYSTNVS